MCWYFVLLGILFASTGNAKSIHFPTTNNIIDGPTFVTFVFEKAVGGGYDEVIIDPGTYAITQNENGNWHFNFYKLANFTITARGVTFLIPTRSVGTFRLDTCANVTLRGVTFIHPVPPSPQGTIIAISPQGDYYDIIIDDGYPISEFIAGTPNAGYLFDRNTRSWKPRCWDLYPVSSQNISIGNSTRAFRIKFSGNVGPTSHNVAVGDLIAFRGPVISDVQVEASSHCTIEDVTVRSATGFVFFEPSGLGANTYRRIKILRGTVPPGGSATPLLASNADGLHSAGVEIGPTVIEAYFEFMPDDGVAIHGGYSLVAFASGNSVIVGNTQYSIGNVFQFYDGNFRPQGARTVLSAVTLTNYIPPRNESKTMPRYSFPSTWLNLTLNSGISAAFDWIVCNSNKTGSNFVINNSTMFYNRARGFLIKARNGLIVGNTLKGAGSMYAMEIAPELYWGEADYTQNLMVHHNYIDGCCYHMQQTSAIFLGATDPAGNNAEGYGHSFVKFMLNTITNVNINNLFIGSSTNVEITNNIFDHSLDANPWNPSSISNSIVYGTNSANTLAKENCVRFVGGKVVHVVYNSSTFLSNISGGFGSEYC